jgi:hypothetical protein
VALLAVAVGAWVLARAEWPMEAGPAVGAVAPGREVAPDGGPPESVQAAPLLPAVPFRAAAAPEAAPPPEEETSVKKTPAAAPSSPATRLLKAAAKTVTAAATCAGLACASAPPPRPPPPEAPCPPGALEALGTLGLRLGASATAMFDYDAHQSAPIPVREGKVRMQLGANFGKLSSGMAVGELIVGKRVYVRFTEAWPHGGSESFPVCLELRDSDGVRGAERAPGDTGETTARAINYNRAYAVERFE